jgi:hypothetical protein
MFWKLVGSVLGEMMDDNRLRSDERGNLREVYRVVDRMCFASVIDRVFRGGGSW